MLTNRSNEMNQQSKSSDHAQEALLTHPKAESLRKLITKNQKCQSLVFNLESVKAEIAETARDLQLTAQAGQLAHGENLKNGNNSDITVTRDTIAETFMQVGQAEKGKKGLKNFGVLFGVKKDKKIKSIGRQNPVDDEASASNSREAHIAELKDKKEDLLRKAQEIRQELVDEIVAALLEASEAERHLVRVDLYKWKVQQRIAQIGPKEKHEQQQSELDRLDPIFEQCGDEIRKLKNLVEQTTDEVKREETSSTGNLSKLQECIQQISKLIYRFVWESCIIAIQPPSVIIKCGPPGSKDISARRFIKCGPPGSKDISARKPQCQPAIRLLGGSSLGCRASNRAEVSCQLISEDQAKCVGKPGQKITPIGKLLHNVARFELSVSVSTDGNHRFFAYFNRPIILTDLHRQARNSEAEYRQRFYFLFTIKMTGGSMVLQAPKVSLPVIVLNGPDTELEEKADAYIFWEHAFAEEKGVLTPVPREGSQGVPWPTAVAALNLKFMQLIEGQDPDSQEFASQPLSKLAERHLAQKFFGPMDDYSRCRLKWEQFYNQQFSMSLSGKGCVFWEWFFAAAEMVNTSLLKNWNKGLIQGFLGKNAAEELLMNQNEKKPMMIIKFSDGTVSCLIITYFNPENCPHPLHLQLIRSDLDKVKFSDIVQDTPELKDIAWIYPNHVTSSLWKGDNASYGKPIHNPYAKRVAGSKASTHWDDHPVSHGVSELINSSERNDDDNFDTQSVGSLSLSFQESDVLSFD